MAQHIVEEGQCLMDVALINYGNIAVLPALAEANELAVTTTLVAGQALELPVLSADKVTVRYYIENKITPATA